MRGENNDPITWVNSLPGTSPRARGKPIVQVSWRTTYEEHPRVRGENTTGVQWGHWADGTSPRARGKLRRGLRRWVRRRNIPACAGKTILFSHGGTLPEEHPRVRGENITLDIWAWGQCGTSPRARGKPPEIGCVCVTMQEHPRVRGENVTIITENSPLLGTSPRARGKPRGGGQGPSILRNIPACAGKTVVERDCAQAW